MGMVLCGIAGVAGTSPSAGRGPLRKQKQKRKGENLEVDTGSFQIGVLSSHPSPADKIS